MFKFLSLLAYEEYKLLRANSSGQIEIVDFVESHNETTIEHIQEVREIHEKQFDRFSIACNLDYYNNGTWSFASASFGSGDYHRGMVTPYTRDKKGLKRVAENYLKHSYRKELIIEFTVRDIAYKANQSVVVARYDYQTYNILSVRTVINKGEFYQKLKVERI